MVITSSNFDANKDMLMDWIDGSNDEYTLDDFVTDFGSYILGAYTGISSSIYDTVFSEFKDFLIGQAFDFDTSTGFIKTSPDILDYLDTLYNKYGFDEYEFYKGFWKPLPQSIFYCSKKNWYEARLSPVSSSYVCLFIGSDRSGYIVASFDDSSYLSDGYPYNLIYSYSGALSGHYSPVYGTAYYWGNAASVTGIYSGDSSSKLISIALEDLFGSSVVNDPVLNGNFFFYPDSSVKLNIRNLKNNNGQQISISRNAAIRESSDPEADYVNYFNYLNEFNNISYSPVFNDIPDNFTYNSVAYPDLFLDYDIAFDYNLETENNFYKDLGDSLDTGNFFIVIAVISGVFLILGVIL